MFICLVYARLVCLDKQKGLVASGAAVGGSSQRDIADNEISEGDHQQKNAKLSQISTHTENKKEWESPNLEDKLGQIYRFNVQQLQNRQDSDLIDQDNGFDKLVANNVTPRHWQRLDKTRKLNMQGQGGHIRDIVAGKQARPLTTSRTTVDVESCCQRQHHLCGQKQAWKLRIRAGGS